MLFHISDASGGLPPARLFGLPPLREDPQAQLLHISARGVKHLQEEEKAKEKEEVKKMQPIFSEKYGGTVVQEPP